MAGAVEGATIDGEGITASYRDASVDPDDEIDGRSVTGSVDDELDAYWFDGDIVDFRPSGDATVDVQYNARSEYPIRGLSSRLAVLLSVSNDGSLTGCPSLGRSNSLHPSGLIRAIRFARMGPLRPPTPFARSGFVEGR